MRLATILSVSPFPFPQRLIILFSSLLAGPAFSLDAHFFPTGFLRRFFHLVLRPFSQICSPFFLARHTDEGSFLALPPFRHRAPSPPTCCSRTCICLPVVFLFRFFPPFFFAGAINDSFLFRTGKSPLDRAFTPSALRLFLPSAAGSLFRFSLLFFFFPPNGQFALMHPFFLIRLADVFLSHPPLWKPLS